MRPFTFRVLPFNESELRGKLYTRFGSDGSEGYPLSADFQEISEFLRVSGTGEAVLKADDNISIRKEHVYIKGSGGFLLLNIFSFINKWIEPVKHFVKREDSILRDEKGVLEPHSDLIATAFAVIGFVCPCSSSFKSISGIRRPLICA